MNPENIQAVKEEHASLMEAAGILYANTPKLKQLRTAAQEWLDDSRNLAENRGIKLPTVGFVGDKNAGKSYLLSRLLITDKKIRDQIPCGLLSDEATEQLIWVGPELPSSLDQNDEKGLIIDCKKQSRFDKNIVLVDLPGFNGKEDEARLGNEQAFGSCQVKVLVFQAGQHGAERVTMYARHISGPIILPVLNQVPYAPGTAEARQIQQEYQELVRKAFPAHEHVCEPLLIPGFDHSTNTETEESAGARLSEAIQNAVGLLERPDFVLTALEARRVQFIQKARFILDEDHQQVRELRLRIKNNLRKMPDRLLPLLVGSERASKATLRIWLRTEAMNRTPSHFFPLRTFMGILALTSRAWDSLTLSLAGSVPSLFKSIYHAASNLRLLHQRPDDSDHDLEHAARHIILDAHHDDLAALHRHLTEIGGDKKAEPLPRPRVTGLGELREIAGEKLEGAISANALSAILIQLTGWLSVAWCIFLLLGPLKAVYANHLQKVWQAVHEGSDLNWSDFPVPPMGAVFGWVFLAFFPVSILALILQSLAATKRRVLRTQEQLKAGIQESMDTLSKKNRLVVSVSDPKINAANVLFDLVFSISPR